MTSTGFSVVAILHPTKGKTERLLELLHELSNHVQHNEPGTLQYEVHRELRPGHDGNEDVVVLEQYRDRAALKAHGSSEKFVAFQGQVKLEGLMRAPMTLKMVSRKAGFSRL